GGQGLMDEVSDLAPAPGRRAALQRVVPPDAPEFWRVVSKVQAGKNPEHRDRVEVVSGSSGQVQGGKQLEVSRTGKEIRPNNVVSFLSQRRELLDDAFAGDIIGVPNHGILQLGDVLTEGENLQFTGLPFFAPELFQSIEVKDPLRTKQLRTGL